jgi:peptidyl-prolyl cis-trans isomerase B (cyclophilin B)
MLPSSAKPGIRWFCVFLLLATHSLHAAVREIATISTSLGVMEFELFSDVSPRAVANFKYLADTKFYDSTAFHRHIAGFMVQGGDPLTRGTTTTGYNQNSGSFGTGGPEYTIPNEPTGRPDRSHVRGVLSMAKTGAPDSGGSQFFILFGDAHHLDNVHAPMGAMISGETVLQAIEARPKNGNDLPLSPLVIHSVRVRPQLQDGTPASRMRFHPGTLSGLLRRTDRNQDVCGNYQLTVTSGGAFSAQVQYYGRRNSFTGVMLQGIATVPEADYTVDLDRSAKFPLRVRLHARQTAAATTSIVLNVGEPNLDGSDLLESTLAVAAGEVASQATLADRYTAAFEAPFVQTGTSATGAVLTGPLYFDLKGVGYIAANVRTSTGLALVTGRLQDGASFTLARPVSNEGGRFLLSLFFHELKAGALFPDTSLADWSSTLFNFGIIRLRLVAALELPPKPSLPQPSNVSGNYLIWYRDAKTAGPVLSRIATYLPVGVAAWTPPVPGQRLPPFALGVKAQLSVEAALVGKFQVARTNAAGVFDAAPSVPQLRFNPVDGTFQGSYVDSSLAAKPRRTFQGVLLQKEGVNKGVGFTLTERASVPVVLAP